MASAFFVLALGLRFLEYLPRYVVALVPLFSQTVDELLTGTQKQPVPWIGGIFKFQV